MPVPLSRTILLQLLQGDSPSEREIVGLTKRFQDQKESEGQFFDFKAGSLLKNRKAEE